MNSYGGGDSLPSGPDGVKRRVAYFYDRNVSCYDYGRGHDMKPLRLSMAHDLIVKYSLDKKMEICRPVSVAATDLARFHTEEYINFLSTVKPDDPSNHDHKFYLGESDCPVFDGLYDFCKLSAGGSIGAAAKLNRNEADIAINWAGGLHHANKHHASGFCYVNDIVLGIYELLKVHRRVLYIDIDVHHGDAVEEAFCTTDRVMTVSFHKYDGHNYFPGTGTITDVGVGLGKNYALNVPLNDGMDDSSFRELFHTIIQKAMEVYRPEAVVLQAGADSLSGDRLGRFNLSVKGHADCLRFLRTFNAPLMLLGGGGYTLQNVARCWCYEKAVALGEEPENTLPVNDYYQYFAPEFTLHVEPDSRMKNRNEAGVLEKIKTRLLEQLSRLPHAPSVHFHAPPLTTEAPQLAEEPMDRR